MKLLKLKFVMMAALTLAALMAKATATFTFTGLDEKYNGYTFYTMLTYHNQTKSEVSMNVDIKDYFAAEFLNDSALDYRAKTTWSDYYNYLRTEDYVGNKISNGSASTDFPYDPVSTWSTILVGFENDIGAGNNYVLFDAVDYSGEETLNPTFDMSSVDVLQSGKLNSDQEENNDPVPEPTSGLFFLLGLAALGLKRK